MINRFATLAMCAALTLTPVTAGATDGPASEVAVKSAPLGKFWDYCTKFKQASNFKTVEPVLDTIAEDGYSVEETLSRVDCDPEGLVSAENRIPMVQLVAEDPNGRENFPSDIYKYFYRKNKINSWLKVENKKNTKGMTLLDYVKYNYLQNKDDYDLQSLNKLKNIYSYVCARGGVLSYYQNVDCKAGL